jgi:hypothetical protein
MGRLLLVALVWGGTSCSRGGAAPTPGAGEMVVQWTGRASGNLKARATARWCPSDTLLEVVAVQGDTSVALALIAQDSAGAGDYPVPETRDFMPGRPQARVALRLLKEFELEGYEASGGRVTVTRGGPRVVSGRFDVRLKPVVGADSLRLTGAFERVPVTAAAGVCGRANKPGAG